MSLKTNESKTFTETQSNSLFFSKQNIVLTSRNTLIINYSGAYDIAWREIRPVETKYDEFGGAYLRAFCLIDNNIQNFYLDRFNAYLVEDTGKIIELNHKKHLENNLDKRNSKTPKNSEHLLCFAMSTILALLILNH